MSYTPDTDFNLEVARNRIEDVKLYNKFGANKDVDTGTPEDIWDGGGDYTGFNAVSGDTLSLASTSAQNAGSLVSSGTATGGSATTIIDTGATFITDGVAVGDCIINDTELIHGIITVVTSETTLTVVRMANGDGELVHVNNAGDSYRVATTNGTGAAVVKLGKLLESDYLAYKSEYIITNGLTDVDTVGADYLRNSRAYVILAGSTKAVVSGLECYQKATPTIIFWSISNAESQTRVAADTVPKGKTIYASINVQMSRAGGLAGSANVNFLVRNIGEIFNGKTPVTITDSANYASIEKKTIILTEYADFKWRAESVSDNNTIITGEINGYIVDNQ